MSPEQLAGLRALAEALPDGTAVQVPRAWLLELLDRQSASVSDGEALPPRDLTVVELAARLDRHDSTVRSWLERGEFPGAYKFRNREWRIPLEAVLRFEAEQRAAAEGGAPGRSSAHSDRTGVAAGAVDLGAWKRA